ncbi:MAG: hypothetical protein CME68_05180 [Halobacteriovoraceae bacterium]|nr:hypothetical protein [Halobacteriovoraceae bacterium]
MKKRKINEKLKGNDSDPVRKGNEGRTKKTYNLKPSFMETVTIFIFFVSLVFVIYFELDLFNGYNHFIR